MAKEVKTSLQKEYQKERIRLLRAVKRGEQEGFIFPEDVVPSLPKRVTKKRLQEIQSIKPKHLYEKAQWVDKETGELVDATSALEVKRKRQRKAKEQDISSYSKAQTDKYYPRITAIDKVRERLETLEPSLATVDRFGNELIGLKREAPPWFSIENRKNELLRIFDDSVTYNEMNNTLNEFEQYLIDNMIEIENGLNIIRYWSDPKEVETSFGTVGAILNQRSLSPEQAERLSAMSESMQNYEEY